jgi:protein-tyrosine-phosphatase/DNA-binding HxlR family transcriptional regulator
VTKNVAERAAALAALGDPVRLEITDLLATSDLSPDAIATTLDITSNLLAHHLKVIEHAGLIVRKQSDHDRRRTYCQLDFEAFEGLLPATTRAATTKPPARVLFVCKHNSARSVLAEAIWNSMSDIPAVSAGTDPAPAINPLTLPAAKRAGLVLRTKKPRPLELVLSEYDLVISVCDVAKEQLPPLTQKRLHWSLPDPAQIRKPAAFDETVNELRTRITRLLPERQGLTTK